MRISGTKIEYTMHDVRFWESRSLAPNLPHPLRVAALAYARPSPNGHIRMFPGDIQAALVDVSTGELPSERTVRRAVATAVEYGLLAAGSTTKCLILPASVYLGLGNQYAPCQVCGEVPGPAARKLARESGR